MFRREAMSLRLLPENGKKVVASAGSPCFPGTASISFIAAPSPDGMGDLHAAFEQLKESFIRRGCLTRLIKKIPRFPERIALITSSAGAAVRYDPHPGARWPMAEVLVLPVWVQGAEAPGNFAPPLPGPTAIRRRI